MSELDPTVPVLIGLCSLYLRPVATAYYDPRTDSTPLTFVPPLTTAEQATFADLQQMAGLGLQTLTLAQFQARKDDVALLRAYLALTSPTAAQRLAMEKAQIRVVGAMLRLGLTP